MLEKILDELLDLYFNGLAYTEALDIVKQKYSGIISLQNGGEKNEGTK